MDYLPYHEEVEPEKTNALVESMRQNGWVGAPLVVFGEFGGALEGQLLTGSHRIRAAWRAEIEPQVITIEEVFEEAGLDLGEIWAEEDQPLYEWFVTMEYCLSHLPQEIKEKYGIDWH